MPTKTTGNEDWYDHRDDGLLLALASSSHVLDNRTKRVR
ncbi:MAG: hypothetical protein KatS3mg105_0037 [Gemmatales bacterium]|nr:MAG: hypothetical protein KatS3mg105_0037 [Gemmatales bacterium]